MAYRAQGTCRVACCHSPYILEHSDRFAAALQNKATPSIDIIVVPYCIADGRLRQARSRMESLFFSHSDASVNWQNALQEIAASVHHCYNIMLPAGQATITNVTQFVVIFLLLTIIVIVNRATSTIIVILTTPLNE